LALIPQSQGQKQEEQQPATAAEEQKKFFVLEKSIKNQWLPISYFDENNNFKGVACFTSFFDAVKYQQRYEEKLINHYLKDNKGNCNSTNKHYRMMHNDIMNTKIFCERELPSLCIRNK
jgi:hypothetical protein